MKKTILVVFLTLQVLFLQSQTRFKQNLFKALINATFLNKNVYKSKATFTCTVAYMDSNHHTHGVLSPIPSTSIISVSLLNNNQDFIRYKELKSEGDIVYIRFLKGCTMTGSVVTKNTTSTTDNVNDYVFALNIKNIDPNKRYLASSAIVGKLLVIPLKVRQKYWDNNHPELSTNINVNYSFGWKFKLGNHPYHSNFLNVIPYAFGVGAQNYFDVLEGDYEGNVPDKNYRLKTTKPETQIAFTYWCSGITYEYDRFNVGLFVGWDAMLKPYDNWGYNKKAWYGIGIGYDIFK